VYSTFQYFRLCRCAPLSAAALPRPPGTRPALRSKPCGGATRTSVSALSRWCTRTGPAGPQRAQIATTENRQGVSGTWAANEHRHPPPARRIPPTAPACLVLPCVGCCAAGSTAVGVACGASERRPPMNPPLPFNSFCAGFRRSRRVRHVRGRGLVVYAPASSHGAAAVVGRGFYRRRRAPSRLAADLNGNQRRKYCKSTVSRVQSSADTSHLLSVPCVVSAKTQLT